jgi:hypothetical protein
MSPLAAAAIAAGELICQFDDGHRRGYLAQLAGDKPQVEAVLLYEVRQGGEGAVLDSRRTGRRPVAAREDAGLLHLIESDGASVRVTTLVECSRSNFAGACTRFAARHAWHFDARALHEAGASFLRQPSGGSTGSCEPWRVDSQ